MSREDSEATTARFESLAHAVPGLATTVRRAMELRLHKYPEGELESGDEAPLPPTEPEELAAYVVELLHRAMDEDDALRTELGLHDTAWSHAEDLAEGQNLQAMVDAYLRLDSSDAVLLDVQHDEILEQKIAFADAVIEEWLKAKIVEAYEAMQEKRVLQLIAGRAIRFTPLTREREAQVRRANTVPGDLFAEGYVVSVFIGSSEVSVGVSDVPDGNGPTGDAIVWSRDHTGRVVQEEGLEILEPGESA